MVDAPPRAGPRAHAPEHILWDVVEEHLDEAEFLVGVYAEASDSPLYTFRQLARGPEHRLRAHIDGLLVGGPTTAERLLLPVFTDDAELARASAAALALLTIGDRQWGQRLIDDLAKLAGPHADGVTWALGTCERPDLDPRITDALRKAEDGARAPLLRAAFVRGVDQSAQLERWLRDDEPSLRLSIAAILRYAPRRLGPWIDAAITDRDLTLRHTAIASGLVLGSHHAWEAAGRLAFDKSAPDRDAMAWVASFGDARVTETLIGVLADEARRADALWALGFSGRVTAADACARWLADEDFGPQAGESFAAITGLARGDDRFWLDPKPEPEDDGELPPLAEDLQADLSSVPADDLVPPNPETIVAWWTQTRQSLRPDTRYIAGVPLDQAGLLRGLRESSTWRRHGIAFELLVRTQGLARVQTRMSTQAQSRQMDALASLPRVDGNRPFGQF